MDFTPLMMNTTNIQYGFWLLSRHADFWFCSMKLLNGSEAIRFERSAGKTNQYVH
jgi:hypothetical protein